MEVYVEPGNINQNSQEDFKVSFGTPAGSPYAVTHADLVCEAYRKGLAADEEGFKVLIDHLLVVIEKAVGIEKYPPTLVQFTDDDVARLRSAGLDGAGEYDLELFLVLFELVEIQEFTNYPKQYDANGRLIRGFAPGNLYQRIRNDPYDLEKVAFLTEVVVPNRATCYTLGKRDKLLQRLREIVHPYLNS